MIRPVVIASLLLFVSAPAAAQETIFDPENPAYDESGSSEEDAGQPDTSDDGGEETIFDPENPDAGESAEGDDVDSTSPAEPENPFVNAEFLGEYGTRLSVDTSIDGPSEDIGELGTYFDLRLTYDPSRRLRLVAEGQFRHWIAGKQHPEETDVLLNATDVRAEYQARVGDAYVVYRTGPWSVSFGNQVIRWGSTDLVRPGDVINPVDMSTIQGSDALERLPQLTLDVTYVGDGWTLSGLLVPFFKANRQWVFGRDTALLSPENPLVGEQFPVSTLLDGLIDQSIVDDVQPFLTATRVPDEVPENGSIGARATTTILNTDLGLGYFFGWDRTPYTHLDPDLREFLRLVLEDGQVLEDFDFVAFFGRNPEVLDITNRLGERASQGEELFFSEYRRLHTLLFDFARFVGPIGVRGDVAFHPEKTYYDSKLTGLRRPTLSSALGLSYERLVDRHDQLLISAEGFYVHPFSADSDVTEAFVGADERGDDAELLLVEDGQYGVASAITWGIPWIESRLQLGGVFNINTKDLIASTSFSHRWYTWLRTSVGATLFEGPDPREEFSAGGLYDDDDFVFLKVDGAF